MKMAKKLLALVLTGVMAMSVLTGCGKHRLSSGCWQAGGYAGGYAEGSKPQCYR